MLNIITNGYVLPFLSKPNLVRFPLILSEYKILQKDQALADCIQSLLSKNAIERVENVNFIALIHPIQWTIAYPVGADRPAKRQKKTSCVYTGQAGPVLCTRQMACRTSFLSRQSDVIASFSFGARSVQANFFSV